MLDQLRVRRKSCFVSTSVRLNGGHIVEFLEEVVAGVFVLMRVAHLHG